MCWTREGCEISAGKIVATPLTMNAPSGGGAGRVQGRRVLDEACVSDWVRECCVTKSGFLLARAA